MDKLKKQMKDKMFFEKAVLFGGTGFIGTHFARYLLDNGLSEQVLLADIKPPSINLWPAPYQEYLKNGQIRYLEVDVRNFIEHPDLPAHADLVVNLAAVHREPGHEAYEYFGTNLPGAENVCEWAEKVGCSRIIFVSSIAPYGPSEEEKYENSLPVPLTPYGSSKLAAEKINIGWQRSVVDRKLIIVRPGVVFGPGEGGNVTRLIRAVLGRYFFYMGNRETRESRRLRQRTLPFAPLGHGETGSSKERSHHVQFYYGSCTLNRRICKCHMPGGRGSPVYP